MTIEMTDELELASPNLNQGKENEVSEIIKLFRFSNLNLIISNLNGEIVFASNSFCNLSGFYVKELVKLELDQVLNKKFDSNEIFEIERDIECFSATRTLRSRNGKNIQVNTYNSVLREFLNTYIVTIVVVAPAM
jgi:PAS domain S-box-containing protein